MGRVVRTVVGHDHLFGGRFAVAILAVLLLLGAVVPVTQAGVNELRVESSSRSVIRFSLAKMEASWEPIILRDGALTLYGVSLPGFSTAGTIGGPRIPTRGGWLVVPPGTRPEAHAIAEQWQLAGGRPLMIEPTPVIQRSSESFDTGVAEILVLPGEAIPEGYEIPGGARAALAKRSDIAATTALTLGEIGWWRGHRVVAYRLAGVLTDGAGQASQVLTGGTWEVRFVPEKSFSGSGIPALHAQKKTSLNDDRFGGPFLNAELLTQVATEAAFHGVEAADLSKAAGLRGEKKGQLLGAESRLAVTRTRMQRVTYESLRSRSLLPDVPIQESEIRLYQRRYLASLDDGSGAAPYLEVEVPIHMVGEGDTFDGDDFFVFYGLRLRDDTEFILDVDGNLLTIPGAGDPYEQNNEANFYWLAASEPEVAQPWARMSSMTLPAATGAPLPNYRRTDHIEEQLAFRENLDTVATDRLYYNNYRVSEVTVPINPLYAPDLTGGAAELKLGIAGWNAIQRSLHFELLVDGAVTFLENYDIRTAAEIIRTHSLPAATLAGPSAQLSMSINNGSPSDFIYAYLNWLEISYDALYAATTNRLDFHLGSGTGALPVEVTGFADADLGLYEITNPRQPVLVQLTAANVVADGATWKLSVMPNQSAGQARKFFAVGSAADDGIGPFVGFRSSAAVDAVAPTALSGQNPDLIVITHEDFTDAIGRWVDHRIARSGGQLQVHVVEVQDIFDWYSGGLKDPWAIKRFMNHTMTQWNSWALMIVGDANENVLGKEVLSSARGWATDWVPTHYHVQHAGGFAPELMATDKWYVALQAGRNYPADTFLADVNTPWDMYSGRFPCNTVGELNNMIDKVITVESPQAGQDWRKRAIFFADDEWSNGLGIQALSELTYKRFSDATFGPSERDSLGNFWATLTAVPLDSVVVLLKPYMDQGFPYTLDPIITPDPRDLGDARVYCDAVAVDPLIQSLNLGGLVCHYQGHANPYLLSSEIWFQDSRTISGRHDIDRLANSGKPWFFMGMGCHIADWAQTVFRSATIANESSLAEKMLVRRNSGASAIYGSSGFEFITANRVFGEYIFRRWLDNPPASRSLGTGGGGDVPLRSRWMIGELMWAAEADIRATFRRGYPYHEMVSQYVLLGDPLMILDAGEAQVSATLVGSPEPDISGEVELVALDASNLRTVTLVARDEAGIDRLQVFDGQGRDLTGQIVTETLPAGAQNHRIVNYSLAVPVLPYDHSLTVRVFDTGAALASDRHYELVLNMPQTADFVVNGTVINPDGFVFEADVPVVVNARITSSAQLNETMVLALSSETLALSNIVFNFNKGRELDVEFTATASTTNADDTHAVVLTIDGLPTEFVVQTGAGTSLARLDKVFNFPNPMVDDTRFVFETDASGGSGVIRVFSVAGRVVAHIKFDFPGGDRMAVSWDGRDERGDELGNGTYLYRVEIETSAGHVVSQMQRLVVMR